MAKKFYLETQKSVLGCSISHYSCSVRITNILENFTLDVTFIALISKLRVDPSPALEESVIAHPNFCIVRSVITASSETLSSMFVNYLNYPCL